MDLFIPARLVDSLYLSSESLMSSPHGKKSSLGIFCHKDVRAVKDSAIVLRAEMVDTLEAEPMAFRPEKKKSPFLHCFLIVFWQFSFEKSIACTLIIFISN